MAVRRLIRESTFKLARYDIAQLLEDHQDDLIRVFHEEIQRLDDEIPEENLFIDIKMVPLSEVILIAVMRAICRFLREDIPRDTVVDVKEKIDHLEHDLVTEVN